MHQKKFTGFITRARSVVARVVGPTPAVNILDRFSMDAGPNVRLDYFLVTYEQWRDMPDDRRPVAYIGKDRQYAMIELTRAKGDDSKYE